MQPPISLVEVYKAASCDMTLRIRVDRLTATAGPRAVTMDYVPTLYIGEHQVWCTQSCKAHHSALGQRLVDHVLLSICVVVNTVLSSTTPYHG